ncbi:uncharacterized protein LOC129949418 [Eupeodes corollae]|uniref:uncharacterized protein LOC129949418 n=1 Tax=Eupeodes corollae TaxID=290404 RepID=UPI0024913D83|nr:uncharacterized protein LOC129949418 [Eupeodes corollae]
MRAAIVCLVLSAVAISADLQSDIEDVASHLPMKKIESIGKQYVAAYPKYAEGLRFVEKVTYEQLVKNFLQTKDGQEFIEYFNSRGINITNIWLNVAKKITDLNRKWLEPVMEDDLNGSITNISGNIMADYRKAIAESDFVETVHKKLETSPEFSNLVATFMDLEFRSHFYRGANSKVLMGFGNNAAMRGFWGTAFKILKAAVKAAISFFG